MVNLDCQLACSKIILHFRDKSENQIIPLGGAANCNYRAYAFEHCNNFNSQKSNSKGNLKDLETRYAFGN